ncbi:sodium channel subunit beta-2 [Oenanthe melanoleuca]|uniref:sodium channel subunit beta-2 n=1 Tax=Oenanthe melanoleuca TaxID=2939378 RepID=UPI0024C195DE|nr:sodium channel subunit beta-2 [Oenanthe melanoleuca]
MSPPNLGAVGAAGPHRVPQSREPALPQAVACSSGENFSALPLRRLQSTNHSIYCFFSPHHRSSHIGLWGESGSNVLCHLQITRAFEKAPPPPPQPTPTPRPLHTQKSVKMSPEAWLPQPTLLLTGLTLLLSLAPPRLGMEVMAPATINALNGSSVKLSCTFNSCYKVENKQFSLNWTYQECSNCSEELFLQFRTKIMNKQLDRFGNRVEFTGNPAKYDVSFTLKNVQLEDEGTYNCYVLNPPDRHRGHGKISLKVLTKEPPKHDSTVAVIVGASVGGFLAVVILVLMVVKCVRRKKQQRLNTDDQKTEEEGKTDGEGNPEEGTK